MIYKLIINAQVSVSAVNLLNAATSQRQAHRRTQPLGPAEDVLPDLAPPWVWWWLPPRVDRGVDRSLKSTTTHQTHLRWTAASASNRPQILENPTLSPLNQPAMAQTFIGSVIPPFFVTKTPPQNNHTRNVHGVLTQFISTRSFLTENQSL